MNSKYKEFCGYTIIEDNTVKELMLPKDVIDFLKKANTFAPVEKKKTLSDKSYTAKTKPDKTKMFNGEDVKASLKEFLEEISPISNMTLTSLDMEHLIEQKAKEIFGEDLL